MRIVYIIIGAVFGAGSNLLINLSSVSFVNQKSSSPTLFSSPWLLVGMSVFFGAVAYWFSGLIEIPISAPTNNTIDSSSSANEDVEEKSIKITRLVALLSYSRLRGTGIKLNDILSFGSVLDVDSRKR